jgi:hypothetical protein
LLLTRYTGRRALRRNVFIAAVLFGAWLIARECWSIASLDTGIHDSGIYPLRFVHFVNRSDRMVCFDAGDAEKDCLRVVLSARQRLAAYVIDLPASSSHWTVRVRTLSLDSPGASVRTADWSDLVRRPAEVVITADGGTRFRFGEPSDPPAALAIGDPDKLPDVRFGCEHDIPVKLDVDLGPGSGGWWIDDDTDRERATWLGLGGQWRAASEPVAHPRQPLPITYRIPAVVDHRDIGTAWQEGALAQGAFPKPRVHVVEVAADGTVSSHPWSFADEVLLALGF